MKILLIMIVCIQDVSLALKDSCMVVPTEQSFNSVNECLYFVDGYKKETLTLMFFFSGFCTSKGTI
jgi:hypothetical protein